MTKVSHQPVLLKEVIDLLNINPSGRYVDGTLGLGGHADAILKVLNAQGRLLGLDVDPRNLSLAKNRLQPFGDQTITRQVNFRGLQGVLDELSWDEVDGLLFDLGVSSTQLDEPERGFSFQQNGPLDMRLDPTEARNALHVLQTIDERDFIRILSEFGEARFAKRLSREILARVQIGSLTTTRQLAEVCEQVLGRRGRTHAATRVFLALRTLVNQELQNLEQMLRIAPGRLRVGGRLAVISFHSLEDRAVKDAYRILEHEGLGAKRFKIVTKKPVGPSDEENQANPRSRSAKLRVLERVT